MALPGIGAANAATKGRDLLGEQSTDVHLGRDVHGLGYHVSFFSRHVFVCDPKISFRAVSWVNKYFWTSLDGKTHNQIDCILIDRRWHSAIVNVRSIREADCDTDVCLVVAKVRERLAVSEQAVQNFNVKRFSFRKLNELKVKKQCQIRSQTGLQVCRT
jgi:hypothetical protein